MKTMSTLMRAGALALMATASAAATEITASVWFPDTHPLTQDGYLALAETLKERSGGDLTLKVYTGTSLLPPAAHLSGLVDGVVQMTYHAGTYTPSDLPEDNTVAALAIGLQDSMVTVMTVADFYLNDPAMQAMFERLGIVFLGAYASPQYQLMCSRAIADLQQVKGAKLRMPSPIHTAWADTVGAASVSVPSSEMYSGLEKGQLDCAANALNDLKSCSLWDVAKYATLLTFGPYFAGWEYAMSASAWGELSAEQRRLLLDAISDNTVDVMIDYQAAADEALAEAGSHGVTTIEPGDDLKASVADFARKNAVKLAVETGASLGAADPEGLVERFQATYAKREQLLDGVDRTDADALKKLLADEIYAKVDAASYGN
ncbi:MAG: TRAP transporter substrate-binding protein DctP [Rhizobiales bacterium]|nr:TRAP transporter substrate-binding protein DctP [Hyphomicrobiales bacterium]